MKRLFVCNFPFELTEEDLRVKFCLYGKLKDCFLIKTREGQSRGFCFVEFMAEEDAARAMTELDGTDFSGRRIAVKPANERIRNGR